MAVSPDHTGIGFIGSYMCDYFIFSLSNNSVLVIRQSGRPLLPLRDRLGEGRNLMTRRRGR